MYLQHFCVFYNKIYVSIFLHVNILKMLHKIIQILLSVLLDLVRKREFKCTSEIGVEMDLCYRR